MKSTYQLKSLIYSVVSLMLMSAAHAETSTDGELSLQFGSFNPLGLTSESSSGLKLTSVIGNTESSYTITGSSFIATSPNYGVFQGTTIVENDSDGDGFSDNVDAFPNNPNEWADFDLDGIGNNSDNDDDNDGMPDSWELLYELNPLDSSDAADDPDVDSFSNLEEFQGGSNPQNTASTPLQSAQQVYIENCSPVEVGSEITCDVIYNVTNADTTLSGLGLRLHFDDAKVEWLGFEDVLSNDFITSDSSPIDDITNNDFDINTTKYITSAWASLSGNWPNTSLPIKLYSLRMKFVDESNIGDKSTIHFSASDLNVGYRFDYTPYELTLLAVNPDRDNDGILNDADNCPDVSNADQINTDGDSDGNACDLDDDNDAVDDLSDCAPLDSSLWTIIDGYLDSDSDGLGTGTLQNVCSGDVIASGYSLTGNDNCPTISNPDQLNNDGDSLGDVCDLDDDNDNVFDIIDNCPFIENTLQFNLDGDAYGDECDNDQDNDGVLNGGDINPRNPQVCEDADFDSCDDCSIGVDGLGQLPDNLIGNDGPDTDSNGQCDLTDPDDDGDGIADDLDNCQFISNASQEDEDGNGVGDACETQDLSMLSCNIDNSGTGLLDFTDNFGFVGNQDDTSSGAIDVFESGNTISLNGNRWRAISIDYDVTPDTVLQFEFSSASQGEIHGIGLSKNRSFSQENLFNLYGTQDYGIQDFKDYYGSGAQHFNIPVGQYLTGEMNFLYVLADDDVASSAESIFSNIQLNEGGVNVDVRPTYQAHRTIGYQDVAFTGDVVTTSSSIELNGNRWRAVPFDYVITENTIIEFDFSSNSTGEIHGFGFSPSLSHSSSSSFDLFGSQNYGFSEFKTYSGSGTQHFFIPVGEYLNGRMSYMYFIADDDDSQAANSLFSNVRVYERLPNQFTDLSKPSSYGGVQDEVGQVNIIQGGRGIRLSGNRWQKIDLPTIITPQTRLEFNFKSSKEGEIHGIGVDTNISPSSFRTFQIWGNQNWGDQLVRGYSADGEFQSYNIPIGQLASDQLKYLVLAMDDDAEKQGESIFCNVRFLE